VTRVSSSAAISSRGVLLGLWLELPTLVIDNDEMKSRCLKQTREVGDACKTRIAFSRRNDLPWDICKKRELALTQISTSACRSQVPVNREVAHVN
jgi:hypothetical protein